jgi:hypothetical protein
MALKQGGKGESDEAEQIGLAALVFMTEDADRLGRFLNDTGLSPTDLSALAGTADGQAAVLDYLLADESLLMVFAAGAGLDPAAVGPARIALAGGVDAHRFAADNYTSGHSAGRSQRKRPSKRWAGPDA